MNGGKFNSEKIRFTDFIDAKPYGSATVGNITSFRLTCFMPMFFFFQSIITAVGDEWDKIDVAFQNVLIRDSLIGRCLDLKDFKPMT